MSTNNIYKTRITCRICGGPLTEVLDLGDIYLNDFVDDGEEIVSAPLTLVKCDNCLLVQLKDTSDLDRLYRQYWYQSSLNKSMVEALQDVVDNIEKRVDLRKGDVVIDIGCNDGLMLSQYRTKGLYKIGFDPAINLAEKASKNCNEFYNTYFGDPDYMNILKIPKAKVITSIAMFYDLEDPHTFVELIKQSLDEDGIWVVQFVDLLSMFKINAFDTICHEHLEYYSFSVLCNLFEDHNLEVFDVSKNDVNGGSIRMYICHREKRPIKQVVWDLWDEEDNYFKEFYEAGLDAFEEFGSRVSIIKHKILMLLGDIHASNKTVFIMGASTKGNTLLQYFGINNYDIPFAAEVNSDKFGKKTVGTNIKIISEKEALEKNPDYFLVLPWHFIDMLKKVHGSYLEAGGKFIVPMPIPMIITKNGNEVL